MQAPWRFKGPMMFISSPAGPVTMPNYTLTEIDCLWHMKPDEKLLKEYLTGRSESLIIAGLMVSSELFIGLWNAQVITLDDLKTAIQIGHLYTVCPAEMPGYEMVLNMEMTSPYMVAYRGNRDVFVSYTAWLKEKQPAQSPVWLGEFLSTNS